MHHAQLRPKDIVIVGGGAAGWLTACLVSHYLIKRGHEGCSVVVIESPDVPVLNVGEGTWPTMRRTLQLIGIDEELLMRRCRASYKQGSRFLGWRDGRDVYDHPFDLHASFKDQRALLSAARMNEPFARLTSSQPSVIDRDLSPKRADDPAYQGMLTYGYHLDSGELIKLLAEHAKSQLKVKRIEAHIEQVESDARGNICRLKTRSGLEVTGQLFIDCTGAHGLLIKRHFKTRWRGLKGHLFNNAAITAHAPYLRFEQPIYSATYATAWEQGWIWDINMAHRRGVGLLFCDELCSDEQARRRLEDYLFERCGLSLGGARSVQTDVVRFESGYHESFWVKNCVAVGMSAGFVEPLEASALVLVERCALKVAKAITIQEFDLERSATEYNEDLTSAWQELTIFLKLHYALSQREERYWKIHQNPATWPEALTEMISNRKGVSTVDLSQIKRSLFKPFSYLCVTRGMGAIPRSTTEADELSTLSSMIESKAMEELILCRALPSNRSVLRKHRR